MSTVRRLGAYSIEQIRPDVFAIDDDQMESMYLIRGKDKALLIDTGSNPEPVMPVVRTLWNGPVELALTHAHFDHMYHCDEFDFVSVGEQDIKAWYKSLWLVVFLGTVGSGKKAKYYPINSYHPLRTGVRTASDPFQQRRTFRLCKLRADQRSAGLCIRCERRGRQIRTDSESGHLRQQRPLWMCFFRTAYRTERQISLLHHSRF